jgi:hypothetical protein
VGDRTGTIVSVPSVSRGYNGSMRRIGPVPLGWPRGTPGDIRFGYAVVSTAWFIGMGVLIKKSDGNDALVAIGIIGIALGMVAAVIVALVCDRRYGDEARPRPWPEGPR